MTRRKLLVCACGDSFLTVSATTCKPCRYEAHKERMAARERTEGVKARKRDRYRQKVNERKRLESRWRDILIAVQQRRGEAA